MELSNFPVKTLWLWACSHESSDEAPLLKSHTVLAGRRSIKMINDDPASVWVTQSVTRGRQKWLTRLSSYRNIHGRSYTSSTAPQHKYLISQSHDRSSVHLDTWIRAFQKLLLCWEFPTQPSLSLPRMWEKVPWEAALWETIDSLLQAESEATGTRMTNPSMLTRRCHTCQLWTTNWNRQTTIEDGKMLPGLKLSFCCPSLTAWKRGSCLYQADGGVTARASFECHSPPEHVTPNLAGSSPVCAQPQLPWWSNRY